MSQLTLTPSNLQTVLIISSISGVTLLGSFVNGALTVALPSIAVDLGIASDSLQWPTSMYALVNGAFLLLAGGLADTLGRKTLFLAGTALFVVLSLAVSFANSSISFTILMALLGLAPALLAPAGTGILGAVFPTGRVKTMAFASLGAGQPIGFIVGLVLGGIFAHKWRALYWLLAALSACLGVQAIFSLPPDIRLSKKQIFDQLKAFDWMGSGLSAIGVTCLIFALSDAESAPDGWSTPYIPALLPTSATFVISFLWWEEKRERDRKHTLLPLSIWKAKGLGTMVGVIFFAWAPFNALSYLSTLMYQQVQFLSPIRTAIYFLPACGAGIILNVMAGNLTGKISTLKLIFIGVSLNAAACFVFVFMDPSAGYALGMLWVVVLTVGPDLFFSAANILIQNSVGQDQQALAGSLFNVATKFATSFGLAVCSAISTATSRKYAAQHGMINTSTNTGANSTITSTSLTGSASLSFEVSSHALLEGLRAAGWACLVFNVLSIVVAVAGLRDSGDATGKRTTGAEWANDHDRNGPFADPSSSSSPSQTQLGVQDEPLGLEMLASRNFVGDINEGDKAATRSRRLRGYSVAEAANTSVTNEIKMGGS
ncbi:hypothetical protein FRB94_014149 [Tulasnella sp. JGI-2019a]|nr:hypothetical protein FRB93_008426 [Tulasnella sp. JGI-2019a]KAG9007631.1 hypothetical protein FRB94_014149 [Tulasnella sp. JGI-2019a]KAG9033089.1 hypothetical protein FRB95_000593 [Tulasnella sp. JGI-2019a]